MTRPADLPDYANPPIDEVAIGIQFPAIDGFTEPYFGLFWSEVRSDYPRAETRHRMEGPIENLTESPMAIPQFQLGPPSGRNWFISSDEESLIQIQDTRLIQNWRRRTSEYPHFDEVAVKFWDSYGKLRDLMTGEGKSPPLVQQVELTYINWIQDLRVDQFLNVAESSSIDIYGVKQMPEAQDWMARYLIQFENGPVARLYVQCTQAIRTSPPSAGHGVQMSLIYKAPMADGMDDQDLQDNLDRGRETIVRAFTDLTTPQAHTHWGRIQ